MIVARPNACTRILVATLAAALALQPLAASAAAITETLAEVPIQGLNPVKPNIMFTMDDSGSMGWDFLPDYVAWVASGIAHCRDGGQCGGATSAPGSGYAFSQYDPPVRSASYNGVFYDASAPYRPGKKADGTDLPCEGSDATCGAPWTAVYSNGFAGYPGANTGSTIDLTTAYPDSVWCWKTSVDDAREADRRYQRLGVPPQRSRVQRRDSKRKHDAGDCRRLQLPERLGHVLGHREVQVRQRLRAERKSLLLHDLAGPVLLGQGRRGLGHVALHQPMGSDDLQVRSLRDRSGDVRSAGLHARRYQVGGIPRQRVRRGQSQRSHLCAGNGQFRQLVCVLPHADTVDEGGVGHRVLRARPELAGRLPHALGEQHALHERQGFHEREQADVAHQRVQGQSEWRHAACRTRCGASASFSRAISRARRLPGATDPLDPVTGKCQPNFHLLSTDGYWNSTLSYASRGNDDQTVPVLANLPGATGFTPSSNFRRPYYEGPTATSNSLADLAMYYWIRDLRPAHRRQGQGLRRAVAARHHLRPVHRRPRHDQLSQRHQRHHLRHGQLASRDGRRRTGSHRRHVARGRQQSRQVFQREQRPAAGGEHRERAGRLHRSVGHRHGGRPRRRPVERDQPVRVQDELRSRHLGRRQEIRDRHRHRRAAQSTPTAIRSTRRCGRRRRSSTRRRRSAAR